MVQAERNEEIKMNFGFLDEGALALRCYCEKPADLNLFFWFLSGCDKNKKKYETYGQGAKNTGNTIVNGNGHPLHQKRQLSQSAAKTLIKRSSPYKNVGTQQYSCI